MPLTIGVAQAPVRSDFISDGLFEDFDFRKAAPFTARSDQFIVQPDFKDTTSTRNQRYLTQFIRESGE